MPISFDEIESYLRGVSFDDERLKEIRDEIYSPWSDFAQILAIATWRHAQLTGLAQPDETKLVSTFRRFSGLKKTAFKAMINEAIAKLSLIVDRENHEEEAKEILNKLRNESLKNLSPLAFVEIAHSMMLRKTRKMQLGTISRKELVGCAYVLGSSLGNCRSPFGDNELPPTNSIFRAVLDFCYVGNEVELFEAVVELASSGIQACELVAPSSMIIGKLQLEIAKARARSNEAEDALRYCRIAVANFGLCEPEPQNFYAKAIYLQWCIQQGEVDTAGGAEKKPTIRGMIRGLFAWPFFYSLVLAATDAVNEHAGRRQFDDAIKIQKEICSQWPGINQNQSAEAFRRLGVLQALVNHPEALRSLQKAYEIAVHARSNAAQQQLFQHRCLKSLLAYTIVRGENSANQSEAYLSLLDYSASQQPSCSILNMTAVYLAELGDEEDAVTLLSEALESSLPRNEFIQSLMESNLKNLQNRNNTELRSRLEFEQATFDLVIAT